MSNEIGDGTRPESKPQADSLADRLQGEGQLSLARGTTTNHRHERGTDSNSSLPRVTIADFGKVTNHLYRGAAPTPEQMHELKRMGIKSIVDLRLHFNDEYNESELAGKLGLKYYAEPLSVFGPKIQQMAEILALINDPKNQPVYVHCLKGKDRTGAVIATELRVAFGRSEKQAYDNMQKYGFNPIYKPLADFVKDSTKVMPAYRKPH